MLGSGRNWTRRHIEEMIRKEIGNGQIPEPADIAGSIFTLASCWETETPTKRFPLKMFGLTARLKASPQTGIFDGAPFTWPAFELTEDSESRIFNNITTVGTNYSYSFYILPISNKWDGSRMGNNIAVYDIHDYISVSLAKGGLPLSYSIGEEDTVSFQLNVFLPSGTTTLKLGPFYTVTGKFTATSELTPLWLKVRKGFIL